MHANLLKETISILGANGKTENDILWIGDEHFYVSWPEFVAEANKMYRNDLGRQEVNRYLKIVGQDFWLERNTYYSQEFWEYKTQPTKPLLKKGLKIFEINNY